MSDEAKKEKPAKDEAIKDDAIIEEPIKEEIKKEEKTKKEPFVPISKQSKLNQKKFNDAKRGTWGNVNPVTRTPPNPKAYNRRKTGR